MVETASIVSEDIIRLVIISVHESYAAFDFQIESTSSAASKHLENLFAI